MGVAGPALVLVLVAIYGAPWVVVTRAELRPLKALAIALLGGLVNLSLSGLVLMQLAAFNRLTVLGGAGVALVVALWLLRSRKAGRRVPAPPEPLGVEAWGEVAVVLALVAICLWARRLPVNFVLQTGDMGEYVNNANAVGRGERLGASFPHLFATTLATGRVLFGFLHTAVVVPAVSAVPVVVAFAFVRHWRGSIPVATLAGLAVAITPFSVWFGIFPVSETMMAAVLLGSVYVLTLAVDCDEPDAGRRLAILAGALVGTGAFIRGTGVVFAALPVLAILYATDRREDIRRCAGPYAVASAVLVAAGVAYNFITSKPYMDLQFRNIFGEDSPAVPRWLVLVACAVFVLGVVLLHRLVASRSYRLKGLPLIPPMLAVALVLGHLLFFSNEGLMAAIDAFGWPLLLAAIPGLLALGAPRGWPGFPAIAGTQLVAIAAVGSLLYAHRIPEPLDHSYYLYWERYSVSEVFPAVIALASAGIAISEFIVVKVARSIGQGSATWLAAARWAITIGVVIAGAAAVVWSLPQIREINRFDYFGGVDDTVQELADLAGEDPIIYAGTQPSPWFFPNTFRGFASPLSRSLGVEVQNLFGLEGFDPDPDLTLDKASSLGRRAGHDSVLVVSVGPAGRSDPLRRECQIDPDCSFERAIRLPLSWRINDATDLDTWLTSDLRIDALRLDTGQEGGA